MNTADKPNPAQPHSLSANDMNDKLSGDPISNVLLARWIMRTHFEQFAGSSVADIARAYIGVYSNRPTSWQAVLARNHNMDKSEALRAEDDPELVRIPGMRRSKFLIPKSMANMVFGATCLPLLDHEWRLREAELTLEDYLRIRPELIRFASGSPVRLEEIKSFLGLSGSQARACTTVATYNGVLVRTPSPNPWSNRWLYAAAPSELMHSHDALVDHEQLQWELACHYIEQYGPVSVEDLAWWMGISKKLARLFLEKAGAGEIESGLWLGPLQKKTFEFWATNVSESSDERVRFLPNWDPLLMGYSPGSRHRSCLGLDQIGAYDHAGNGLPVVLIGSKAVTTWRVTAKGSQRLLSIHLPDDILQKDQQIIQEAAVMWAERIGAIYIP